MAFIAVLRVCIRHKLTDEKKRERYIVTCTSDYAHRPYVLFLLEQNGRKQQSFAFSLTR